jgi:demethylmenaquinone methyltransferase / 2-methoxy-6-polyprenyl-1,4-benzoquinol methylase
VDGGTPSPFRCGYNPPAMTATPLGKGLDPPLDKRGQTIQSMFAGVAPRYDFLNRLLSMRLDTLWRRRASAVADQAPAGRVLDLCCGTGDQSLGLARRGRRVAAADFCVPMLVLSQPKFAKLRRGPRPTPLAADALALPFPDAAFAALTVSFGVRNVADLDRALREMRRVLVPGGQAVILEASLPTNAVVRPLYLFYFRHILPKLGRLFSPRGTAYQYFSDSVVDFPSREAFLARMTAAGFVEPHFDELTAGTVCLYRARRPF